MSDESIAELAQKMIRLAEEVPGAIDIANNAIAYDTSIFNSILAIKGNMHDPFVVTMQAYMQHADKLLEEYIGVMQKGASLIRSEGYRIARAGGFQ